MNIWAITGLVFDIVGVVMLYFCSPKIPLEVPDGSEIVTYAENGTKANQTAGIAKQRINLSQFALIIIIVGFVLQLIGQLPYKKNYQPDRGNYTNTGNNEIEHSEANIPLQKIK